MDIPQEIRSKISQLDDLSREILEFLEDNDFMNTDVQSDEDFMNELESLQTEITNFQESKGWI